MIELKSNRLVFSFPEVHPEAQLSIEFQRTLRIPDDDNDYPLPPGLGRFPLKHVDDYLGKVPALWKEHGGVIIPMYQAESLWLNFNSSYIYNRDTEYPFAMKIATGKINAVSGNQWDNGLSRNPQNYVVASEQPWLDGYCVEKGIIRQFVAMPLGKGYTAEEQLTREGKHGGIQIQAFPMKKDVFEKRFPSRREKVIYDMQICSYSEIVDPCMGVAPGGRMVQEIYEDPFDINDWDLDHTSRCFVHIANSQIWKEITGKNPPTLPPTAKDYSDAELPWFEYYADNPDIKPLKGSKKLSSLKTVKEMGSIKEEFSLPENDTVNDIKIINLGGKSKNKVREGNF